MRQRTRLPRRVSVGRSVQSERSSSLLHGRVGRMLLTTGMISSWILGENGMMPKKQAIYSYSSVNG